LDQSEDHDEQELLMQPLELHLILSEDSRFGLPRTEFEIEAIKSVALYHHHCASDDRVLGSLLSDHAEAEKSRKQKQVDKLQKRREKKEYNQTAYFKLLILMLQLFYSCRQIRIRRNTMSTQCSATAKRQRLKQRRANCRGSNMQI
jgi:hypothetical protein